MLAIEAARNELRARVESICLVPELPPELAEDLREAAQALDNYVIYFKSQTVLLDFWRREWADL